AFPRARGRPSRGATTTATPATGDRVRRRSAAPTATSSVSTRSTPRSSSSRGGAGGRSTPRSRGTCSPTPRSRRRSNGADRFGPVWNGAEGRKLLGVGRATAALTALLAVAALVFGVGGASPRALASTDVAVEVIGQGNVQDDKFQLDCGGGTTKCYATYTTDSGQITLTAEAASDWTFSEWSNCSAVNGNECTVNLSGGSGGLPKEIIVSFSKSGAGSAAFKVDVAADSQGDLHGDVVAATGSDFEISCGSIGDDECDADPPVGSTFTLYVDDIDAGYAFSGWSGSCDAQRGGEHAYCVVHLTADKTIGASFSQSSTTAKVTVTVTGQGTVTGGGLACTASGGTCSVSVTKGQSVTLEETPQTGATFLGWGGACAGKNPTCTIPQVNADKSVTAQFSGGGGGGGGTVPLTVSVSGPGTVTGSGINCGNGGTTCTASPASGATVTLTATPASGATFQGWGGACSGNSRTCS